MVATDPVRPSTAGSSRPPDAKPALDPRLQYQPRIIVLHNRPSSALFQPRRQRPATAGARPSAAALGWIRRNDSAETVPRFAPPPPKREPVEAKVMLRRVVRPSTAPAERSPSGPTAGGTQQGGSKGRRKSSFSATFTPEGNMKPSGEGQGRDSKDRLQSVDGTKKLSWARDDVLNRPASRPGTPQDGLAVPASMTSSYETLSSRPNSAPAQSVKHRPLPLSAGHVISGARGNPSIHRHLEVVGRGLVEVPSWIYQRQNLTVLSLKDNRLTDLPNDFFSLTRLQQLELDRNRFVLLPDDLVKLTGLQVLSVCHNELEELPRIFGGVSKLRELRLSHNKLREALPEDIRMAHLQTLEVDYNKLRSLPEALGNAIPCVVRLTASNNRIRTLPSDVRHLRYLTHLDLSSNKLSSLPHNDLLLCLDDGLTYFNCRANRRLTFPPPEVANQGGEETATYLRAALENTGGSEGFVNTELILIVLGDGEAGKTSTINGIISDDLKSMKIGVDDRTVGINFRRFHPKGEDLTMTVLDLAGQAVYSMMHQFFFLNRAVYLFVWRARKSAFGGKMSARDEKELETMVVHWMDTMQLLVPGASLVCVVTHIDTVNERELSDQCHFVRSVVKTRLDHYKIANTATGHTDVPLLKVLGEGESVRICAPKGMGVKELRDRVIQCAKDTPWYKERLPGPYLRLRQRLQGLELLGGQEGWLTWRKYHKLAEECGVVEPMHLRIVTQFLHDVGVLRYFGDVERARHASDSDLAADCMLDTVFTSVSWIVDVMKGLIRHNRGSLLDFFNQRDKVMSFRVRRLITNGILHPSLMPFLWPRIQSWPTVDSAMIADYWNSEPGEVDLKMFEHSKVAIDRQGLERAMGLLEGLDVAVLLQNEAGPGQLDRADSAELIKMKTENAQPSKISSIIVPGLLSASRLFRVDARVFGDKCLFRCAIVYSTIPSGFFERLIVKLRRHFGHMDFNATSAAFYHMGKKLQVFLNRTPSTAKVSQEQQEAHQDNMELLGLFSSTTLWAPYRDALAEIEVTFPGIQRVSFRYAVTEVKQNVFRAVTTQKHKNVGLDYDEGGGNANSKGVHEAEEVLREKAHQVQRKLVSNKNAKLAAKAIISPNNASKNVVDKVDMIANTNTAWGSRMRRRKSAASSDPTKRVFEFERTLVNVKNPIQVLISHAEEDGDLANQIQMMLLERDSSLSIAKSSIGMSFNAVVLIVVVDKSFAKDERRKRQFQMHAEKKGCVMPLIQRDYEIVDYGEWWPVQTPEFRNYSLFLDFRGTEWYDLAEKAAKLEYYRKSPVRMHNIQLMAAKNDDWGIAELAIATGRAHEHEAADRARRMNQLHFEVKKGLEEWRGEQPDAGETGETSPTDQTTFVAHGPSMAAQTECVQCVESGEEQPATFNREECQQLQVGWRIKVLDARARDVEDPEPPSMTCSKGHQESVDKILSSAVIYDSVPCPQCAENGISPPFCFNRQTVIAALETTGMGVTTCPKCMRAGHPAVRILNILAPEVFLSYQWGYKFPLFETYTTQELVRRYRRLIEVHADVLCWLDVEGGLSAGMDHVKQMTEGVSKSHVVVVFLSDAYVLSENCRREYEMACNESKYIIPVLIPPYSADHLWSGWNGPGVGDGDWWKHADRVSADIKGTSKINADWSILSHFEPIDLRQKGLEYLTHLLENDTPHDELLIKRILARFHRGTFVLHAPEKKLWSKIRAVTKLTSKLMKSFTLGSLVKPAAVDTAEGDPGDSKRLGGSVLLNPPTPPMEAGVQFVGGASPRAAEDSLFASRAPGDDGEESSSGDSLLSDQSDKGDASEYKMGGGSSPMAPSSGRPDSKLSQATSGMEDDNELLVVDEDPGEEDILFVDAKRGAMRV